MVSIREASLPPGADEFSERFASYPLISLVDLVTTIVLVVTKLIEYQ